jgi:diguanylate cyclase (GGDEF)-like protein
MGEDARARVTGHRPGRPFLLLAVYFAVSATLLAALAVRPPIDGTPTASLSALAAYAAVLGIATLIAWARRASAALPALVGLGMAGILAAALVSAGAQGQIVDALFLTLLGIFAGYFLSVRVARVLAVLAGVGYVVALSVNWRLESAVYLVASVTVIVSATMIVSSLVGRLRDQAVRDPLTGVLNRRGLDTTASHLHQLDARRGAPTAVVAIDLDDFKKYNDDHGHQAGDALLVEVTTQWQKALRRADVLARSGGDEFVMVLPGTTDVQAVDVIARLRSFTRSTWSAGIADWEAGETLDQAMSRADQDLYRNKRARRGDGGP